MTRKMRMLGLVADGLYEALERLIPRHPSTPRPFDARAQLVAGWAAWRAEQLVRERLAFVDPNEIAKANVAARALSLLARGHVGDWIVDAGGLDERALQPGRN